MSEISVFAPAVGNLWNVIRSYGIDPDKLLHENHIDLQFPIDPDSRLSYDHLDQARSHAANLSGDEAFGLRCGVYIHPSQLGALGYAWLASRTLRIALERWQRYIRILNKGAGLSMRERGNSLENDFAIEPPSLNLPVRDDGASAVLTAMLRLLLGSHFQPSSVALKRLRPTDTKPWVEYFGCHIEFAANHNRICVPIEQADLILPSANPHIARLSEEIVARYLERLDREDFTSRVRAAIVHHLSSGNIDRHKVSETLHVTTRTMRRRRRSQGMTFKSLLTSVRRELADRLILDPDLTLTEISFILGFSKVSSFTRAFRNWNGQSPTEARKFTPDGQKHLP